MATGKRTGPDDLTHFARLAKHPEQHHIFHALRVIEAQFSDRPRLGESRRPKEDAVRLGQEAELAFPPSTIAEFTPPTSDKPGQLINRFFGLFGPHGPLPLHLTEFARDRLRNHRDSTFIAFANMLTHRLMSLLFRAWSSGQPAPNFDRGEDDLVERKVAALAGYGGKYLRGRDAMPDLAKRHFAGHLAMGPKNPDGLIAMISAFFAVPVEMQEFVGCWLELEPDDRWQLGSASGLGRSTSIGHKVWSRGAKFRLRLGPMPLTNYERLLPGGASLERLRSIVRNYVGDMFDWDINLILAADDVPRATLGGTTRLGHTSWIGKRDAQNGRDAEDLFLHPTSVGALQ